MGKAWNWKFREWQGHAHRVEELRVRAQLSQTDKVSYFTISHWKNLLVKEALSKFFNKGLFLDASEPAFSLLFSYLRSLALLGSLLLEECTQALQKSLLNLITDARDMFYLQQPRCPVLMTWESQITLAHQKATGANEAGSGDIAPRLLASPSTCHGCAGHASYSKASTRRGCQTNQEVPEGDTHQREGFAPGLWA